MKGPFTRGSNCRKEVSVCVEQSQWRIHHDGVSPYLVQVDFHKSVIMCTLIWYKDVCMLLCQGCYVCIARKERERWEESGERGKRREKVGGRGRWKVERGENCSLTLSKTRTLTGNTTGSHSRGQSTNRADSGCPHLLFPWHGGTCASCG